MPAIWTITPKTPGMRPGVFALPEAEGVQYRLDLRPNISMGNPGFVRVIGISALFLALPLLGVLGTPVLWGLLPFAGAALWAIWYALMRNRRDRAELRETLHLSRDRLDVTRHDPRKPARHFHANPYWVKLSLKEAGGPVENYLTLSGAGREIELGAFLSPEERAQLHDELAQALRHLK